MDEISIDESIVPKSDLDSVQMDISDCENNLNSIQMDISESENDLNSKQIETSNSKSNLKDSSEVSNHDFKYIQDLVDKSNSGDSIFLDNGLFKGNGSPIIINKDLNIYAENYNFSEDENHNLSKSNTVLDGDFKSNIFLVNDGINLNLYGLSLINGYAKDDGAAIYNNGILTLENCLFENNSATNGGSLFNTGTLSINNTDFISNTAKAGGAIYNQGQITISGSKSNNNYAKTNGGLVYNEGILNVKNTIANSNEANYGGVFYNSKELSISNSSFDSNKAFEAASIYNYGKLNIDNSNFTRDKVSHKAGTMIIIGGDVNISNSIFRQSEGADEGGIIFTRSGNIFINSSQFISNKALSYGAAIDNSGNMSIFNSIFDNNKAFGAGAIDNGGNLIILNSNFTNNKVTNNGGAIDNNGNLFIGGSIFENNTAGADGGALISRKNTTLNYNKIINNNASSGNGVYNKGDYLNISDNWWGLNNPDFDKLLNFQIDDEFRWIIMSFENSSSLVQNKNSKLTISLNQSQDRNNQIYEIETSDLPVLKASIQLNRENSKSNYKVDIINGTAQKSIDLSNGKTINGILDYESISLIIEKIEDSDETDEENNPITEDKNESKSMPDNNLNASSDISDESENPIGSVLDKKYLKNYILNLNKKSNAYLENKNYDLENGSNKETNGIEESLDKDESNYNYLAALPIIAILLILIALKRKKDDEENN